MRAEGCRGTDVLVLVGPDQPRTVRTDQGEPGSPAVLAPVSYQSRLLSVSAPSTVARHSR